MVRGRTREIRELTLSACMVEQWKTPAQNGAIVTEYSQWHYILGYMIVLSSHNWPLMICISGGLFHAWRLYREPKPLDVRLLYGWAMLGLAYEYRKHLQGIFDEAVDFLMASHFGQWNSWGHLVIDALFPVLIGLALWMFWAGWRVRGRAPVVAGQLLASQR